MIIIEYQPNYNYRNLTLMMNIDNNHTRRVLSIWINGDEISLFNLNDNYRISIKITIIVI